MTESIIFSVLQDVVFFILFVGIAVLFGKAFYNIYKRTGICKEGGRRSGRGHL